ncbi:hypothetical protein [Variovorax sp. Root434]|uniref:hypothetical protein n=1 Tax=unclassified Variovorax TaxID=663243 RepID=UPI0006F3162C|nr:hypothetical protein [Variovorax sp. Root434]KQX35496.1 hypothetical protein ASD05_23570 [Variovorax sp. Root434]
MSTDFTFPLALCKAQCSIWLHSLEMFETIGSRLLQDGIALTRAEADAVTRAEDWHALAMAPMRALQCPDTDGVACASPVVETPPSRRTAVSDALRTLHVALARTPSVRQRHAGRKATATRGRA